MDTDRLILLSVAHEYLKQRSATAQKAQTPEDELAEVSKAIEVVKAWPGPDGSVYVEGWISTNRRDLEKDQVEPEAFQDALPAYMALAAPLSYEHQMKPAPVGHVQKAALVRDGRIFAEFGHVTDPAEFEHFPNKGTGVYGRAVINEPSAAAQVHKGNVRGFSWTGRVKRRPLPDGGHQFTKVEALRETTIAAYPINPTAAIVAAD